jgi:hypothetical protein
VNLRTDRLALPGDQHLHAMLGEIQQPVHLVTAERGSFGAHLNLDQALGSSHDEIAVDTGLAVLRVVEIEDRLPPLYEEATGEPYPGRNLGESSAFSTEALALLKEVCTEHEDPEGLRFELIRELLHIEERHRTMARRSGLFKA